MSEINITEEQLDCIKEIFNIGVGKGAQVLSQLLESHIQLEVPQIHIFKEEDINSLREKIDSDELANVKMGFTGSYDGMVALSFEKETAKNIVDHKQPDGFCHKYS